MTLKVVLAEDSPTQSLSLRLALEGHGFTVEEARNGKDALELARQCRPDVIISDALMPRMDGFQLCRRVRAEPSLADTPFIIRTSIYRRDEDEAFSLAVGADAYVSKSTEIEDVVQLCRTLAGTRHDPSRRHRLDEGRFEELYNARILQRLVDEVAEAESAYAALERTHEQALMALIAALDLRDTETEAHSWRVMAYAMHLAGRLGDPDIDHDGLRRGALLHDIGKIGVPDRILRKPGPLNEMEWAEMRKHPAVGHAMLGHIEAFADAAEVILCHHERWDGHGYPQGLAGDQIPINARIFAVADTLDAVSSDRPYRAARDFETALRIADESRGTQLDPRIVDAALETSPAQWRAIKRQIEAEIALQHAPRQDAASSNADVAWDTALP